MRRVAAFTIAIFAIGCSGESKAPPKARTQIEVRLEATDGLPTFLIEMYFDAAFDPRPHVQSVTAAIVVARGACFTRTGLAPETSAVIAAQIRARKTAVEKPIGCLAHAMDGATIDDTGDFHVDLTVRVGA